VRDEDPDLLVLRTAETKRWDAAIERLAGPEVIVHYQREDEQYELWTMRVALGRLADRDARWKDEDPIVHTRVDAWGSVFRVSIYDATKCIELRPMSGQGNGKDLWSFVPSDREKPEIWVRRGDSECYFSEPAPRAGAA
jgi:hypothetical protein